MQTRDALIAIKSRLSKPGGRIIGQFAENCYGNPVAPTASSATCWCLAGAIANVTRLYPLSSAGVYAALDIAIDATGFKSTQNDLKSKIIDFNDASSDEAVLSVLDRAIEVVS